LGAGRSCAARGRAIAMRYAGTVEPVGGGYSNAFNDWLTHNRFNLGPSHRAKLLAVMGILPAVEAWRATLTERERRRMNPPRCCTGSGRRLGTGRPTSSPQRQRFTDHVDTSWRYPAGLSCFCLSRAAMAAAMALALCSVMLPVMAVAMSSALSCLRSNSEPSSRFASLCCSSAISRA
jgi:hypothetical protein